MVEALPFPVAGALHPAHNHPFEDEKRCGKHIKQSHDQAGKVLQAEAVEQRHKAHHAERIAYGDGAAALPQAAKPGGVIESPAPVNQEQDHGIARPAERHQRIAGNLQRRPGSAHFKERQNTKPQEIRKQIGRNKQNQINDTAYQISDTLVFAEQKRLPLFTSYQLAQLQSYQYSTKAQPFQPLAPGADAEKYGTNDYSKKYSQSVYVALTTAEVTSGTTVPETDFAVSTTVPQPFAIVMGML